MNRYSLSLCVLMSISVHAAAATYDMPAASFSQQSVVPPTGVTFVDRFNFSLLGPATLFASTQVDAGIGSFTVALYKLAGPTLSLGSFVAFAGPAQSKTFAGLTSGDYYYQAAGLFTSGAPRAYTLTSITLAAPEPAALLLALAGIATVFLLRRRSK